MSDVHVLAIDLTKRSFQIVGRLDEDVCGCPRFCKGFLLTDLSSKAPLSVVYQAFDCGLPPLGRYAVQRMSSTSVHGLLPV